MDAMMMAATPGLCAGGIVLAWWILASPYLILRSLLRRRPLDRRMAQNQVRRHRQRSQPQLVPLRLVPANPNGGSRSRSLRHI